MAKQLPKTDIPWADRAWPVLRGCSHSGTPGCDHCYSRTWFRRFGKRLGWKWGKPIFFPENLDMPKNTKKPCRVFVAPMSDPWHKAISIQKRIRIFSSMLAAPQHCYILLTKRPENIDDGSHFPDNWWVGVSCENQEQYDERWPELYRRVRAAVRFVSAEPLMGDIGMKNILTYPTPNWIIAGPETGVGAHPCDPRWITKLAEECSKWSIPFYDKRKNPIRRELPQ